MKKKKPAEKRYAKALFALPKASEGCLTFELDEMAEVLAVKEEWYHVILLRSQEQGFVPADYWQLDVALQRVRATFDFEPPQPEGFIPLVSGDVVVLEKGGKEEEWWLVRKDGQTGYVPSAYVELL